jgi:hypothetical protein
MIVGDKHKTLLASAVRTATTSTDDITSAGAGAIVFLDVTATPNDAQTLTVSLQAKDPVTGKYVTITAFAALTASVIGATSTTATYAYTLRPGAAETAAVANHEVQALAVPKLWRVTVTHSAAGNWTYTVGLSETG